VFRTSAVTGALELLLGSREGEAHLELPRGFLLPDENPERGLLRVMARETGWRPVGTIVPLHQGYAYDPRQTDHAWIEVQEFLLDGQEESVPDLFEPEGDFEDVGWWTLDSSTLNRIPPGQAEAVQRGLTRALEEGRVDVEMAGPLVSRTG
jgi:ADP-ribose pyrophosphatase YjhB (NUDIX family)